MKLFLLVFVTFNFSLSIAQAELPYAQKILLKAEFDRAETTLSKQIDQLKDMRANITEATATRDQTFQAVDSIFVFVLETLYKTRKMEEFNYIAASLNDKSLRKNIYYPVQVDGGINGKKTHYVSMLDYNCVNPKAEENLHNVILIEIDTGSLSNKLGRPTLKITHKNGERQIYFASYAIENNDPFFKILQSMENQNTDFTDNFNCRFVGKFQKLDKENKALLKRYAELSKVLDLPMKDFKGEKQEKSITEELVDLTKTMPGAETPSTDVKATPVAPEPAKTSP